MDGLFDDGLKKSEKMRRAHFEKWLKNGNITLESIDGLIRDRVRACRAGFDKNKCHVSDNCEECDFNGGNKTG